MNRFSYIAFIASDVVSWFLCVACLLLALAIPVLFYFAWLFFADIVFIFEIFFAGIMILASALFFGVARRKFWCVIAALLLMLAVSFLSYPINFFSYIFLPIAGVIVIPHVLSRIGLRVQKINEY
ncbi:MAG TPA: hypothetical protein VN030_07500 [Cellvibrio sp.]|nr:hypothetical protein [Cellvibrio sp.]